MLKSPFDTTRKMKVPYKSRIGRRERMTILLYKVIAYVMGSAILLAFVVFILEKYGLIK